MRQFPLSSAAPATAQWSKKQRILTDRHASPYPHHGGWPRSARAPLTLNRPQFPGSRQCRMTQQTCHYENNFSTGTTTIHLDMNPSSNRCSALPSVATNSAGRTSLTGFLTPAGLPGISNSWPPVWPALQTSSCVFLRGSELPPPRP